MQIQTLTGSFFPDDIGFGHAVGLTVDDQLSIPFDVYVRRFDGPLRGHYSGIVCVCGGGGNKNKPKLIIENDFGLLRTTLEIPIPLEF